MSPITIKVAHLDEVMRIVRDEPRETEQIETIAEKDAAMAGIDLTRPALAAPARILEIAPARFAK